MTVYMACAAHLEADPFPGQLLQEWVFVLRAGAPCCWVLLRVQVSDVNGLVERLLMFLESGYDHIVAETLIQLRDLLRRYPDLGEVSCRPRQGSEQL